MTPAIPAVVGEQRRPSPSASPDSLVSPQATPSKTDAASLLAHVYAPYFETYTDDSIADVAAASGVKHFALAFLETTVKHSCTLAWNGDQAQPVSAGRYLDQIAALRAAGGDVIPSLGRLQRRLGGTEIGDSCTDVGKIVAAYEDLVKRYDVKRVDMDVEDASLARAAGIDRRNKAIRRLQDWATAQDRRR